MFGLSLAMQHNRFSIVDLGRMSVIYGANGRIPLENVSHEEGFTQISANAMGFSSLIATRALEIAELNFCKKNCYL